MAIYRLLESHVFEPQHVDVMTTAYEDVLGMLRLADRADPFSNVVARRVTELALVGEGDPQRIRQQVLRSLDHDLMETP
jgi:hypothetical protein